MIHSGSRNLGKQVADHYNKVAIELNSKWHSSVKKEEELAFLPVDTQDGKDYLNEMAYCVEFALCNRKLMMFQAFMAFLPYFHDAVSESDINIAHNYAAFEKHYGKMVWVHRKGATLATKDTIGIIPGSQ